ncbi:MAG: FtsX-like permease family protein [Kiritimatiellae bacterium]|nr:FtsX-like permease family protein [Kiritimatiellia bacterium]
MPLFRFARKELFYSKWNSLLGLLAVVLAVGTTTATGVLLSRHEWRMQACLTAKARATEQGLESVKDRVAGAMAALGFDVIIVPRGQELGAWHAEDGAEPFMPEAHLALLQQAALTTIRLPVAQLRQRVKWPETGWTVFIAGRSEPPAGQTGALHAAESGPIPPGTVLLGHELHRGLGFREGDACTVLGKPFTVGKCLAARGNKDDITIRMNLPDAQALLAKPGLITEILAVATRAAWANLPDVRKEVAGILPQAQVVELNHAVRARALAEVNLAKEARATVELERRNQAELARERRRLGLWLNALVVSVCAGCLGLLAWANADRRLPEIGIWAALGMRARDVVALFVVRWLALGLGGGLLGLTAGVALGVWGEARFLAQAAARARIPWAGSPAPLLPALGIAAALTALACCLPVVAAMRRDPVRILASR